MKFTSYPIFKVLNEIKILLITILLMKVHVTIWQEVDEMQSKDQESYT